MLRRRRLEVKENAVIFVSVQEPHSPFSGWLEPAVAITVERCPHSGDRHFESPRGSGGRVGLSVRTVDTGYRGRRHFPLARLIFCFLFLGRQSVRPWTCALRPRFGHAKIDALHSPSMRTPCHATSRSRRLLWKTLHTTPELSSVPLIASTFAGSGFFLSRVGSTACSR
jgi:hypothetical protein